MVARLLGILVGDVQADMVQAMHLHLLINGTSYDVAGSQTEALVIFLHERLAIGQFQHTAIATHGLRDEVCGMRLVGVVQDGGMELYELHIGHRTLGTIDHCYAVARSNHWIRGSHINSTAASRTHNGNLRQIRVHLLRLGVQHIGTIAADIGRAACHANAQMVLRDNLYSEMVLLDVDIGIVADSLHQSALYLGTRIVSVVQDAKL